MLQIEGEVQEEEEEDEPLKITGYTQSDIEAEKHCIEYRVWNRFVTFKGLWLNVDSRSTRVKAC